jgi:isocitrate dehydrogenase kinase/phosphatase
MHEVLTETELNNKHTEIELNDPAKMDLENVNESQVANDNFLGNIARIVASPNRFLGDVLLGNFQGTRNVYGDFLHNKQNNIHGFL